MFLRWYLNALEVSLSLTLSMAIINTTSRWLHILYLFTASDIITIIVPKTFLGVIYASSPHVIADGPSLSSACRCAPVVLFWVWINLLPLDIMNQTDAPAIEEDRINKPWRPLPAGLVTMQQARMLVLGF